MATFDSGTTRKYSPRAADTATANIYAIQDATTAATIKLVGTGDAVYVEGLSSEFTIRATKTSVTLKSATQTITINLTGSTGPQKLVLIDGEYSLVKGAKSITVNGTAVTKLVELDSIDTTDNSAANDYFNNGGSGSTGTTFTLTAGIDNGAAYTGTSANDTFIGNTTAGVLALTTFDSIDGGLGNDSLSITVAAAVDTTTALLTTVTGIESATINSTSTITANTTAWTGLTSLSVNASDDAAVTASATTDVVVTATTLSSDGTAAAELSVNGGKNVTTVSADSVTLAGGPATSGQIIIGGTTAAAGTVSVTHTETAVDAAGNTDATGSTIAVTGGTTVVVNSLVAVGASDDAGDTMTVGAINVTGNASTTSVTVNQTAAAARTATAVGVVNGGVTIADGVQTATGASTISSVSLTNFGASSVDSSALTSVTLGGTGGTFGIGRGALDATPTANTLALNVNALTGGAITDNEAGADDGFTTINLANTGTSVIANLTAADLTTLNISGSGSLTLTANTLGGATTANITNTSTGSVTLGGALSTATNYTGGAGDDTITLAAGATGAIATGGGVNTVTVSTLGTGATVNGGTGSTDVLSMDFSDAATASGVAAFETSISGFERLSLTTAEVATVDLTGLDDINYVTLAAAGAAGAISGFTTGGTLVQSALFANTVTLTGSFAGASDSFNYVLNGADGYANTAAVTLANVETVNFTTNDNDAVAATTAFDANIDATSAVTVTVGGDAGITFANSNLGTALTRFDASLVTVGPVTYTTLALAGASSITGGAGADTLIAANALAAVTLSGNAGADTLTGSSTIASTINGGAGNDTITGGAAADSINGGDDTDTYVANDTEDAGASNTLGQVVNLGATAVTSAQVFATTGNYLSSASTSVAANTAAYLFGGESSTNGVIVDTLTSIENVTGSADRDYIVGSAAANRINGAAGADWLTGGAGADTFVLTDRGAIDTITDFTVANDVISLNGGAVAVVAQTVAVATAAGTATLVFDTIANLGALGVSIGDENDAGESAVNYAVATDTGAIFFDADGDWTAGSVQIGTIGVVANLVATNFVI